MAHDPRPVLDQLDPDGPLVMGILNTTPDSFSDGGSWGSVDRAVAHGEAMIADGADIIDIGGESSRPGAEPVTLDEELARTIPVIEGLRGRCVMSIDSAKPDVAEAALRAGAHIVNDITAKLEDVAAAGNAGWIAMHMQGAPQTMQHLPEYGDVAREVADSLCEAAQRGKRAGIRHLWVDPGIGFGKTTVHNLELLQQLEKFAMVDAKTLVGVSRKRFIGEIHSLSGGITKITDTNDRREGSLVAAVWSWLHGAHIVRVHDVRASCVAARHVRKLVELDRDGF